MKVSHINIRTGFNEVPHIDIILNDAGNEHGGIISIDQDQEGRTVIHETGGLN